MSTLCPECKKDLEIYVIDKVLPDISVEQAFTCPYCGAKLVGVAEIEIHIQRLKCVVSTAQEDK